MFLNEAIFEPYPHDIPDISYKTAVGVATAGGRLWQRDSEGSSPFFTHQRKVSSSQTAAMMFTFLPPCSVCLGHSERQRKKIERGGDYLECLSFTLSHRCIQMNSDPPIYVLRCDQASSHGEDKRQNCPALLTSTQITFTLSI